DEDRADAERARDLVADDDAAERRREDHRRPQITGALRDRAAQRLGMLRMLQHQRALQIARAVQARGQPEVSVEQRARAAIEIEEIVARHAALTTESVGRMGPWAW